jgi:hypothetical protein
MRAQILRWALYSDSVGRVGQVLPNRVSFMHVSCVMVAAVCIGVSLVK